MTSTSHAPIGPGIFVGLVIPFRDGGDQHGLVRAQLEVGRADQVAHVFDDQKGRIGSGQVFLALHAA